MKTNIKFGVSLLGFFVFAMMLAPGVSRAQSGLLVEKQGHHYGDAKNLEYWIEYQNSLGVTTVRPDGISYIPFVGQATYDNDTILPAKYLGDYALYFNDQDMSFVVHVKNIGKRTYKNLLIGIEQELLNTSGASGVPFPGSSNEEWKVDELRPGEEVALTGSYHIPVFDSSGLDQTHLVIAHYNNNGSDKNAVSGGQVIVNDPQAGVWCPVAE